MSEGRKLRSPRTATKTKTPDTSFAASPFAKDAVEGAFSPSTPFKNGLSAFPPLRDIDGFDETWLPDSAKPANGRRLEDFASPFEEGDLESFFGSPAPPA